MSKVFFRFDVFVEYAKAGTEDILIRISAVTGATFAGSASMLDQ
jgi:hypothetical protein